MHKCKSCGAIDTRISNGDNCICTECGTPDDFECLDEECPNCGEDYNGIECNHCAFDTAFNPNWD